MARTTLLEITCHGSYFCEIWDFENSQIIENLHNDFLRQIDDTPIYDTCSIVMTPNTNQYQVTNDRFGLSIDNGKYSKLSKLLYAQK